MEPKFKQMSVKVDSHNPHEVDEYLINLQVKEDWIPCGFIIRYSQEADEYYYEFIFKKPDHNEKP